MFCLGIFVRGVFGKRGFCPGGFCPGVYVRGVFVWGVFVLIPLKLPIFFSTFLQHEKVYSDDRFLAKVRSCEHFLVSAEPVT